VFATEAMVGKLSPPIAVSTVPEVATTDTPLGHNVYQLNGSPPVG